MVNSLPPPEVLSEESLVSDEEESISWEDDDSALAEAEERQNAFVPREGVE